MSRVSDALPDFFVLGVAKGGTTSLHYYLRQHPALFLPYAKELHYFDADDEHFATDLGAYLQYFTEASNRLTGDATPSYFRNVDPVAGRMQDLYDDEPPRFLLLLRDPVQRAYSHYLHNVSEGREPLPFEAALDAEKTNLEQKREAWKTYFSDGVYANTLSNWFARFPRDRFLILRSEELAQTTDDALQEIFRFLDVDPTVEIDTDVRLNRTGERQSRILGRLLSFVPSRLRTLARQWTSTFLRLWVEQFVRRRSTGGSDDRPSLNPKLEAELRARYAPHVHRLGKMIDRDISAWLPEEERPTNSPPSQ